VADETGLPAAAAILESLPEGTIARGFAEVASPEERQPLPVAASFSLPWLHRDGAPAGTTTLLPDPVRALRGAGGSRSVGGGAGGRGMAAVGRSGRPERALPRERGSLVGYWRPADHDDPHPDEDA